MAGHAVVIGGGDDVSNRFARGIADGLGVEYLEVQRKIFPDGESYIRLPEANYEGARVVLVKTMAPPQDKAFFEILAAADALSERGVDRLVLVAPYTAYARQDREFLPYEAVSIRALLRALARAGVTHYYTVEIHKEESLSHFEGGRAYSVSPYAFMASKIPLERPLVVLAPDLGAVRRAREFAAAAGAEFDYLVKRRDRVTGDVTIEPKELDVRGKHVVIVDDIISTGGTVARAASMLLKQGATAITVVVAHALLVEGASRKLKDAGVSRVYAANTLPNRDPSLVETIDVSPLVAGRVREALE